MLAEGKFHDQSGRRSIVCGLRPANPMLAISSVPEGVLLTHVTRSLSANAEPNGVKKVALLILMISLALLVVSAICVSQYPYPGEPVTDATTLILRGF